jgi:hypothetical protein
MTQSVLIAGDLRRSSKPDLSRRAAVPAAEFHGAFDHQLRPAFSTILLRH